jgi:hypothetical protein
MIRRLADGLGSILDGKGLRLDVVSFGTNEKERTHAPTFILRPLSHLWCPCREALHTNHGCAALKLTCEPEVCRY